MKSYHSFLFFLLIAAFASQAFAESKITQLSLEELMDTEVSSVLRSSRPLSQSAAAVTVINQEDIRRSSATILPELLRMVPGLTVARHNSNQWAISARGFNAILGNKMLLLIDGRVAYSRLHSGIYWDVQDILLENIERIEVIRGPGASAWGSNAVNGVINVITKNAHATQGVLAKSIFGFEEQTGAARYGGKIGEDFAYRTSIKYFNRDSSFQGNDAWSMGRANYRSDWNIDDNDNLMISAEYYNGEEDLRTNLTHESSPFTQTLLEDGLIAGGHFLTRWDHTYSERSNSTLQVYFDQTTRDTTPFDEIRYIGDIDWQHQFWIGERNNVVWGASYQLSADRTDGTFGGYFDPGARVDNIYSAFLQDTFTLIEDKLWITAGSKFEVNDYTGFELQPTARLLWQINEKNSVWTAVSRAVSVPSRLDHDLIIRGWLIPGVNLAQVDGDSGKESEDVIAYEAGYRAQPHKQISIDIAGFINDYSHLRALSFRDRLTQNGILLDRYFVDDQAEAYSYGTEIDAKVRLTDDFWFQTGYSFIQIVVDGHNESFTAARQAEGRTPDHQLFFRTFYDLPYEIELDSQIRYVDRLKNPSVPSYWEMDLRLAWRPVSNIELAVIGQNLFHNHHLEFPSGASRPEIERNVYGKAVVEF